MKSLKELQGSTISILLPDLDETALQEVTLRLVEDSGLWIESQTFTNMVLGKIGLPASSKTPVLFVPWHRITTILQQADGASLHETSFGV